MSKHWKKFGPPVYIAVAGYLGLTKPDKKKSAKAKDKTTNTKPMIADDEANLGNLEELAQMLSGSGGMLHG